MRSRAPKIKAGHARISSTSVMGGIPSLLGPDFAAKAGMDQLAVASARELAAVGIDTAIVGPGAYNRGHRPLRPSRSPSQRRLTVIVNPSRRRSTLMA